MQFWVDCKSSRWASTQSGSFYLTMTNKVITVEYARQKLGERGQKMTDQQVSDLLNMLRLICNKTIDAVVEKSESN